MFKSIITITLCSIVCSLPIKALAASLSDIVVFGDSFVDDGNFFELSKTIFPDSPSPNEPYFEGRFSNGLVWSELLGEKIGVNYNSDNNFAFGGAGTGRFHQNGSAFPSLLTQIDNYIGTREANADPNALYILSAGPNDSLTNSDDVATSIGNLSEAIINLAQVGAKNFLVQDLPDLSLLPINFNLSETIKDSLSLLSKTYNQNLALSLQNIEQNFGLNIASLEIDTLFHEVIAKPEQFGFTTVSEAACFNLETLAVCDNPNEYAFWDLIHPSAESHKLIADFAAAQINSEWGDDDGDDWEWEEDDDNDDDDDDGREEDDDDNWEKAKDLFIPAAQLQAGDVTIVSAPLEAQNIPESSYPLSMFTFLGLIYLLRKCDRLKA